MPEAVVFEEGSYRFLPGGLFSNGIAAELGYVIQRVRFVRPQLLAHGLRTASEIFRGQGRPLAALAACVLRSPRPLIRSDFVRFNEGYVGLLRNLGLPAEAPYPIGRSNLAPAFSPPTEETLFAFSYTTPAPRHRSIGQGADFVISGKPENRENEPWPQNIVAATDLSPAGLERKAEYVLSVLRERVRDLSAEWASITAAQVYTVHPLEAVLKSVFAKSGLPEVGLTLFPSYPPIVGLEFEVDVRSVSLEQAF